MKWNISNQTWTTSDQTLLKGGIKPSLAEKFAQTTQAFNDQVTFKQFSKLNHIIYFSFFFQIRI
jgi:hypothetical protein